MGRAVDRRILLGGSAALIVLLGLTLTAWSSGGGVLLPFKQGPVAFTSGEGVMSAGIDTAAGSEVVFGGNWIENTGSEDAALTSARLVGDVDPELAEVKEVRVLRASALNDEVASFGAGGLADEEVERSWEASEPIESLVLAPDEAVTLVFRVAAHEEGDESGWGWPKTELSYSVNGRDYVTESHYGFYLCPPSGCSDQPPD